MKTKVIIAALILAVFAGFMLYHSSPKIQRALTPSASTVRGQAAVQSTATATSPAQHGIALISANDPVFAKEFAQLSRGYAAFDLKELAKDFNLTPESKQALARAMATARLSQMIYEAEIAHIDASDQNHVVLSIPVYSSEGVVLRSFLQNEIAKATNAQAAQAFVDDLAKSFDSFGDHPQTMELTPLTKSRNGKPVSSVAIKHVTTGIAGLYTLTSGSLLDRNNMHEYTPFETLVPLPR